MIQEKELYEKQYIQTFKRKHKLSHLEPINNGQYKSPIFFVPTKDSLTSIAFNRWTKH